MIDALPAVSELPLWGVWLLFVVAAGVVAVSGSRLASAADTLATRTGLSRAFLGALMLGFITSLPEVVTTVTAGLDGEGQLAANNLLGGVGAQIALIAVADAVAKGPLLRRTLSPMILLQGVLLLVMLALVVIAIAFGEPFGLWGIGAWTILLFATYVFSMFLIEGFGQEDHGHARDEPREEGETEVDNGPSNARLGVGIVLASITILVAGVALVRGGTVIARESGLGTSFVGAAFLAIATSLPEVSTVVAAARAGNNVLAISNILGTNILEVGLLALADAAFRGGLIIDTLGDFSLAAAGWAVLLTAVVLVGLLRESRRTIWRMSPAAALLLVLYVAQLAMLYRLR